MMKNIFLLSVLLTFCLSVHAQVITNVRFVQEVNMVKINYDLNSSDKTKNVNVYCSDDGGETFGPPLVNVRGDCNNVSSGPNKEIIWDVLKEQDKLISQQVSFKVEAWSTFDVKMVFVEGGTFTMGNNKLNSSTHYQHAITIGNFYISQYEFTQDQWNIIMDYNPSSHKNFTNSGSFPVENVSYSEIKELIRKIYDYSGLKYRLPTEAEWEYAARGGKFQTESNFSGSDDLKLVGWHLNTSANTTKKVGLLNPNKLGLYDMSGNVSEICSDYYDSDYYLNSPTKNPNGPENGTKACLRGGSFLGSKQSCSVYKRDKIDVDNKKPSIGFRLAIDKENYE